MRNAENWPECFTLPLPVMCIVFSFSHFGIQLTDCGFNKHPSFGVFDAACLYLRHTVTRGILGLVWNAQTSETMAEIADGLGRQGGAVGLNGNGGGGDSRERRRGPGGDGLGAAEERLGHGGGTGAALGRIGLG